jgi:hypothetical protein
VADIEFWIQIENRAWDLAPNNIDRMHGWTMQQTGFPAPVVKTLTSPETVWVPETQFGLITRPPCTRGSALR